MRSVNIKHRFGLLYRELGQFQNGYRMMQNFPFTDPIVSVSGSDLFIFLRNISRVDLQMTNQSLRPVSTVYNTEDYPAGYRSYGYNVFRRITDWNSQHVSGGYILAHDVFLVSLWTYRYRVRNLESDIWTTVYSLSNAGDGATRTGAACIHVIDDYRIVALQADTKQIKLYSSTGTSSTWSLTQSIMVQSSMERVDSIVMNNFTEAKSSGGAYYMALSGGWTAAVSGIQIRADEILVYKNVDVKNADNSWVLHKTISGFKNFGARLKIMFSGNQFIVGVESAASSSVGSLCAFLQVYDASFELIQVIKPSRCITHLEWHSNDRYLAIGDDKNAIVHIFRISLSGQYLEEDTLEYDGSRSEVIDSTNFGKYVLVSESDEIFVHSSEGALGINSDTLLRYKKITSASTEGANTTSLQPLGDCVSGYFESFASDGGTAMCMYAYGASYPSLCATNGAGENDEVCANTYTSGDFLYSHSCRVNGAWDEVCIANLCLSSELCTGYQKSVTGTTYWLQGGSGSQASYSNSNYKCCRENLP